MNCKKATKLVILDLYGELKEPDKTKLHEHLRECRACSEELALTKKTFAVLDENRPAALPSVDWDRAWSSIRAGISRPPLRPRPAGVPGWRWAFAGAAFTLVLVAGIFIGKYGFAPPRKPIVASTQPASSPPNGIRPLFAAHLEDVKPILLDYAHYEPGEKNGRRISVDEDVLRGLVLQNILLKRKLAEKDPAAVELLDDIDLVLKEIKNRQAQNHQSPAEIKDLIEQRDILFRLEILKKI